MTLLHLRVVTPDELVTAVVGVLEDEVGAVTLTRAETSHGTLVTADVARECVDDLLDRLKQLGVLERGMVTLAPLDTALGRLAQQAEDAAPGEGADALIWDDLVARTGEESTLTWTFAAFMTLACLLAAIGVVTDSTVTIVGAMVVGPEFGPLAGLAVALLHRRPAIARAAARALVVGFVVAMVLTAALSLVGRWGGLFAASDIAQHTDTEFIYQPGWFSLVTALVAGAAGMLSLTSSKSAALVGVFISVTTIPAAGNAAVAATVGEWDQAGPSLLQLGINLVGIVASGVATLLLLETVQGRRGRRHPVRAARGA